MNILCCQMLSPSGGIAADVTMPLPPPKNRLDRWKDFRRTLYWLRKGCPPAMPVVVLFSKLPDTVLGNCGRRNKRFVIRLNKRMGECQACDVLVHEWAHAVAWNYSLDALAKAKPNNPAAFDLVSHDETWGCAYSRAWRVYTASMQIPDSAEVRKHE